MTGKGQVETKDSLPQREHLNGTDDTLLLESDPGQTNFHSLRPIYFVALCNSSLV